MEENFPDDEMEDELIYTTLEDDDGNEYEFVIIDSLEHNDEIYHALVPSADDDDDNEDIVILRSEEVDGELMLGIIEDDEEYEKISAMFIERLSDQFDFD